MSQRVATAVVPRPHPPDLYAWHTVCAAAMVLMLLVPLPGRVAGAMVVAFVVGACWSGIRMTGRGPLADYARLCVCCVAMSVMLLPHLGAAMTGSAGMHMHGGALGAGGTPGSADFSGALSVPVEVTALLVLLLVVVAVPMARRVVAPAVPPRLRAGACFEAVMAAGMAAMLVSMH